ncbi:hypothetical protein NY08_4652 [Rhodococcus sp. B7740]|nr:hypothetical protein NY08_4652 [Rhodococcus sp. B7740]
MRIGHPRTFGDHLADDPVDGSESSGGTGRNAWSGHSHTVPTGRPGVTGSTKDRLASL